MSRAREKRVYPGGNTGEGFYSYYHYVLPPEQANRIFILKGGPGGGKSTLMRYLSDNMLQRGYDVELHYCSSDLESLDAVVFPQIGVALMDGTAPHSRDPKYPGAVDEIVDLGQYWNGQELRNRREEIIAASQAASRSFQSAYRALMAAKIVHANWEAPYTQAQDFGWVNQVTQRLAAMILNGHSVNPVPGKERHLFGAAFTPAGPTEHFAYLLDPVEKKFLVKGSPGTGKSTLLKKIGQWAKERGLDVEYYHSPLVPTNVDHLILPQLDTVIATSGEIFPYEATDVLDVINLDDGLDQAKLALHRDNIAADKDLFFTMLQRAIAYVRQAKEGHGRLEGLYVPTMDFSRLNEAREEILHKILAIAEETTAAKTEH